MSAAPRRLLQRLTQEMTPRPSIPSVQTSNVVTHRVPRRRWRLISHWRDLARSLSEQYLSMILNGQLVTQTLRNTRDSTFPNRKVVHSLRFLQVVFRRL